MKKQKGITLIALTITIVVIMILAGITANFGLDLIKEVKLQDLRTNMLLIQAKAKECVEEVSFQKANAKEEEIDTIKQENLKGIKVENNSDINKTLDEIIVREDGYDYYYLTEQDIKDMGIKESKVEDYGYFIIGYNIDDIKVEVINTIGYDGNYTLSQLNDLTEE